MKVEQICEKVPEDAMACCDLENLLVYYIEAFQRINRIDEAWREGVLKKRLSYDAEFEGMIGNIYRDWLEMCERFVDSLCKLQETYIIECADQFLGCIREAKGILKEDSDFFSGEELVDLRDAAIDGHQRGETRQ